MNETFITVLSRNQPFEVDMAVLLLENEGINCFLENEFTVNAHPFYSNAVGGIKLNVRPEHAENAIITLKEAGYINSGDDRPELAERINTAASRFFADQRFNKVKSNKNTIAMIAIIMIIFLICIYYSM
jgi:hypothetical protein